MSDRQNILFIVFDQMRADCLHGALSAHLDLPNMRRLMADGVCFSQHYSVAAPCGPARASLLTGQYAMNHRSVRNGTPLAADTPNVATEVRKQGYLPLLYGYTDSAQDPRQYHPRDPVLTTYEEVMTGFHQVLEMRYEESWPWRGYLKSKGYDVPRFPEIYAPQGDQVDDPALYASEDSDTAFLTSRFLEDVLPRPRGWFAHLTYVRPHPPLVAPAPYNRLYSPSDIPGPLEAAADDSHPFDSVVRAHAPISSVVVGFPDLLDSDEMVRRLRSIYFGLIAEIDVQIGRIMEALRSEGAYDDTLIVLTSDHGEMLGDRQMWGKTTYHDAAFHVPLVIKAPGGRGGGTVVDEFTESIDVTPTILDYCRVDLPDAMDGRSLRPFVEGKTPGDWRSYSVSELDFGNPVSPSVQQRILGLGPDQSNLSVLRTKRHRLVHFAGDLPQILFDMEGAGEARDISTESGNDKILLDLSRLLLSHRMVHADGTFARTMITSEGVKRGRDGSGYRNMP